MACCGARYSASDSLDGSLNVDEMVQHILVLGRNGLINEYEDIKDSERAMDYTTCSLPENVEKNRYKDIPCIEQTRVVLSHDSGGSDYIHANYVDGYQHKKAYILTQGPLEHTVVDFWRMVVQENVRVIVMTTRLKERGGTKCSPYWPQEHSLSVKYGDVEVNNGGISHKGNYQVTNLEVRIIKTDQVRRVKHFLYLKWPDKDRPEHVDEFLKFMFHIRVDQFNLTKEIKWKGHRRGPPIIVHCSAGIGRTDNAKWKLKRIEDVLFTEEEEHSGECCLI